MPPIEEGSLGRMRGGLGYRASSLVSRRPVKGTFDGGPPHRVLSCSFIGTQSRIPLTGTVPATLQPLHVRPVPHCQPGHVRGAETDRFRDHGPHYGEVEDVGNVLHEQVVGRHAAINFQRSKGKSRVGVHRLDYVEGSDLLK